MAARRRKKESAAAAATLTLIRQDPAEVKVEMPAPTTEVFPYTSTLSAWDAKKLGIRFRLCDTGMEMLASATRAMDVQRVRSEIARRVEQMKLVPRTFMGPGRCTNVEITERVGRCTSCGDTLDRHYFSTDSCDLCVAARIKLRKERANA